MLSLMTILTSQHKVQIHPIAALTLLATADFWNTAWYHCNWDFGARDKLPLTSL